MLPGLTLLSHRHHQRACANKHARHSHHLLPNLPIPIIIVNQWFDIVNMSLAEAQRARALEVMDKLSEYSISKMFAQPVDPERDNISGYFDHVKTPMDLGTVRKKLDENVYPSMAAWKDDVELVWSNSLAVHGRTSLLGSITLEMQDVFRKLSQHVTDNPESDWMKKTSSPRTDSSKRA